MLFKIERTKKIFERFHQIQARPKTELKYNSPFQLLIALLLSAQARDVIVNKVTEILFKEHGTPEAIIQFGEDNLINSIRTIGLYRVKANNIIKLSRLIINQYDGQIPNTREKLQLLPGIGRKSANVFLNTIHGIETIGVDTHIFRVSRRLGLSNENTTIKIEQELMSLIPKVFLKNAHHWLVLHGRYTCIAKKPKCQECCINDLCEKKFLNYKSNANSHIS